MNKGLKEKLAYAISAAFTPPLVISIAILAISIYYSDRYQYYWLWAIVGVMLLIGPASIYVYMAYRKGKVTDINLSDREERLRPLIIALIGAMAMTLVLLERSAPKPLTLLSLTLVCELIIIIFVTVFWKISLHALAFSSTITLLAYLYSYYAIFLYVFLVPIGWARIYRKRHTLLQVVAGSVVGVVTALAVFMLFGYPAN